MKTIFHTRTLLRAPLALSLLAAAALVQPAHAGLLGGAGSVAGGFAGQGSFGPRSLDVGGAGSAAGSLQRTTTTAPPRPATAVRAGAGASHDAQGTAAAGGVEASRGDRSVGAGVGAQSTR